MSDLAHKISDAELAEWNNNAKLAEAIERQMLLDALESDPHLIKTRPLVDRLNSMLAAWRDWSDPTREIARELGFKCKLGQDYKNNGEKRVFQDAPKPDYSNEDMEWIDARIQELELPHRAAITQEIRHKDDKYHRDKWLFQCRESGHTGLLLRSYTAILKEARESLILSIMSKYK